ncbi:MAG: DUF2026 family protein [Burkholderia sp.]
MSPTPPISINDYCRLHGVIRSVLAVGGGSPTKSCIFYALAGAYLLSKHHGMNAMPAVGGAFVCTGGPREAPQVLNYAKQEDGRWYSDQDAFHAWIQIHTPAGEWMVDLTAPLYREALIAAGLGEGVEVPRRAFVRSASDMADDVEDLAAPGDFLLARSPEHTAWVLSQNGVRPDVGDLIDICAHWYRPWPSEIPASIPIGSTVAASQLAVLSVPKLDGYWGVAS